MAQSEKRRSEDIRADVSSQLFWDDRIDESDISVDVAEGQVILTGTVPTCAHRRQAEDDAWSIAGVRHVDNRLRVSPTASPLPGDTEIASTVRTILGWNPTIDSSRIDVSASGGVVTLSGAVESYWQKSRAAYLAASLHGVVDVSNLLRVEPAAAQTDEDIRGDILTTLARNTFIDDRNIEVEVSGGTVTLTGTVGSYFAWSTAGDIAKFTSGVVDVHNDLAIV